MRNLKKVLSLTLALVMMLSMMTFAGAAETTKVSTATDLTDMKDVANKEAVTLLVDLKVIAGRDDNTFDPAGSLKRAEFAKLIYVAKMGSDDKAANFVNAATGLTDVAGTWFEGYVNYAFSTGIVSGTSKTTFTPNGLVKVAEAAKMLLVGLGYDAKAEGYSDNALWSVNVMQQAKQTGLLDGIKLGANVALTRDAAAQMVFNALMAKTVTNTYGFDMNGKKYITGATVNKTTWGEEIFDIQKVEGTVTGISTNGKAMVNGVIINLNADPAVIGCKVAYYKNSETGKMISSALLASRSTVLATSTDGTLVSDLRNPAKAAYLAAVDTGVSYYLNGVADVSGDSKGSTGVAGDGSANGVPDSIDTACAKVGAIVELIDNDGNDKFDVVRVTVKTVDVVGEDAVTITKATAINLTDSITIAGVTGLTTKNNVAVTDVYGYEGLKKDDVVLSVKIGNKFYIEKAATVTGSVTGKKVAGYVLGGTAYPLSGLDSTKTTAAQNLIEKNYNKDATLYLDNNKSIVVAKLNEKAAADQYAVVVDIVYVAGTAAAGVTTKGHADAFLVYPDGTSEVKQIADINGYKPYLVTTTNNDGTTSETAFSTIKDNAGATGGFHLTSNAPITTGAQAGAATANGTEKLAVGNYAITYDQLAAAGRTELGRYVGVSNVSAGVALEGKFYTYTVNKDKTVSLTSVTNDAVVTGAAYATGQTTIGASTSIKVNDKTVFILANKEKFTVYTGISKMTSLSATMSGNSVTEAGSSAANYVFVNGTPTSAAGKDTAYFGSTDYKEYIPKNGDVDGYYVYDAVVNGKLTTVKVAATGIINAAGFWELAMTDGVVVASAGGTTTAKQNTTSNVNGFDLLKDYEGVVKAANGVIGLGKGSGIDYYTYTADTKVFYVSTKGVITESSVANIVTSATDTVVATVVDLAAPQGNQATTLTALFIQTVGSDGGVAGDGTVYAKNFTVTSMVPAGGAIAGGKITLTPTLAAGANTVAADMDGSIVCTVLMLNPINGKAEAQYTKTLTLTDNGLSGSAQDLTVTAKGFYQVAWTVNVNGAASVSGTTTTVEVTA